MARITNKEVEKIASLADLSLTASQINELTPQLSEIVDYIDTLNEIPTNSIEPTSQITGLTNVKRSDEVNPNRILSSEIATSNTENVHNDYFIVGALLNKEKNKS